MRPIDIDELEGLLPAGWQVRADAAYEKVAKAAAGERGKTIDKYSEIWADLKEALKRLSNGKCWYCESRNPRADNAVDHFRPKGRVAEAPGHGGYWWKAFDWRNYRFTCTYCNSRRSSESTSGGKQDHFPLRDPDARAKLPTDRLEAEEPLLLDPINPDDVGLLTFDLDGNPAPAKSEEADEYAFNRALQAIRFYHLDHPETVERRAASMRTARQKVQKADAYQRTAKEKRDLSAQQAYRDNLMEVGRAVRAQAEYSAAARAAVGSMRGTSGTAVEVFERSW